MITQGSDHTLVLQRVAPRSFVVDVDGTLCRCDGVDLRVAEHSAQAQQSDMLQPERSSPDRAHVTGLTASAGTRIVSGQKETDGEEHPCTPHTHGVYSPSGRLSRLDL